MPGNIFSDSKHPLIRRANELATTTAHRSLRRHPLNLSEAASQMLQRENLIYAIPLKVKSLPAAVKLPGFLSPSHCRRLISLARRKGLNCIENDRYGQASTTAACRLLPEDDELIYKRLAHEVTQLNAELWRLSLAGIYEPVSVLCYRPADWIRPHIDADYRVPDPSKLSCSVQLVPRGSFAGGVLTIAETESFDLDIGDAVVFPSHMLHTISPIKSGERFALAAWIHGPPFQ